MWSARLICIAFALASATLVFAGPVKQDKGTSTAEVEHAHLLADIGLEDLPTYAEATAAKDDPEEGPSQVQRPISTRIPEHFIPEDAPPRFTVDPMVTTTTLLFF